MASPTRAVTIELGGKVRSLRFTFEALAAIEDTTGKLPAEVIARAGLGSPNAIAQLVWAALLHESPDLSVAEVRKLIDLHDLEGLAKAINDASDAAYGKGEPEGNAVAAA